MYVKNSSDVSIPRKFFCSERLGKYLVRTHNLPMFGRENGKCVFIETPLFKEIYDSLPFYMKLSWI